MYDIMEWNINQATNVSGKNRIPDFITQYLTADIVILTEFCCSCYYTQEFLEKAFVSRNYNYCYTHNAKNRQNDIVIAWRKDLFDKVYIDDEVQTKKDNNLPNYLSVTLKSRDDEKLFVVAGIRITIGTENCRKEQMTYAFERLRKISPEIPVIIGGDFNNFRRGYMSKEWSIGKLNEISNERGYTVFTPDGQSIYEAKAYDEEHAFAEDHIVSRLCTVSNFKYDRGFARENSDIYAFNEDFQVYNHQLRTVTWRIPTGSGVPDHAIIIAEFDLKL